jgi:hypothetical protein
LYRTLADHQRVLHATNEENGLGRADESTFPEGAEAEPLRVLALVYHFAPSGNSASIRNTKILRRLPEFAVRLDLVTIDVSFISLRLILPVVPALLREAADVIALVKPQFEAGRAEVGRNGIITDPEVHRRVIAEVSDAAAAVGLHRVAWTPSPITGAAGNREFLAHFHQVACTS